MAGNLLFARLLRGDSTPPPSAPGEADLLSNDPLGAYRNAADALVTALRRPEALAETVALPFGQVSGVIAVHVRIVEVLVHGWDVAVATGQQPAMPQDLAEREIEFSVGLLEKLPSGRMPFAPPQPVPDDAPAMDRLVALVGRRV